MDKFEWHAIHVNDESIEYKTATQKFYIRLEKVDGAEVTFIDYKLFALLALVSLFATIPEQVRMYGFISAALFAVAYFLTRRLIVQIHGGNVVIKRVISGKDLQAAEVFIDNLKNQINAKHGL